MTKTTKKTVIFTSPQHEGSLIHILKYQKEPNCQNKTPIPFNNLFAVSHFFRKTCAFKSTHKTEIQNMWSHGMLNMKIYLLSSATVTVAALSTVGNQWVYNH